MMQCKFPLRTLLVCAVAAAAFFFDPIADALIFDRVAIANGQWWRLFSGNFVHLSAAHFASDMLGLLAVGAMVEVRGARYLGLLYIVAGLAVGLVLYWQLPQLRYFGGLSGIVSAAATYLCLAGACEKGPRRAPFALALGLVTLKIAFECALDRSLLTAALPQSVVFLPQSHLAGAGAALAVFMLATMNPLRQINPRSASDGRRRAVMLRF
ncbi:MAG TPA: rhombosortase [Burkholderiaceae bacterium]|nr:rhombosortase [Burkholderiaceae bacterium]